MRKKIVLGQLNKIDDEEWLVILAKARKHVEIKTRGRTKYGAHAEENLGMPAVDYYVGETISRLFEGVRDWKFETRSLEEEFIRIIDSMISEEVRKIEDRKEGSTKIISVDPDVFLADDIEDPQGNIENIYSEQVNLIFETISDKEDLEEIFLMIHEGNDYDQISEKLDIPKQKVYRAIDKIKRKVKAAAK